jgi:hypothetical protein
MNGSLCQSPGARFLDRLLLLSILVLVVRSRVSAAQVQLQTVALTGQTGPNGWMITDFYDGTNYTNVVINKAGQVAFFASGQSGDGGWTLILRSDAGQLTQIADTGTDMPLSINAAGQVSFRTTLNGDLHGVAFYRGQEGPLTQIARTYQALPDGQTVYELGATSTDALNDSGQMAFSVFTGGGRQRIVRGDGGPLTDIVRAGQTTPDGSRLFELFSQNSVPVLNSSGQVAFDAYFNSPDGFTPQGIYRGDGGPLTEIARRGQPAPGGGTLDYTFGPLINSAGQVAFGAYTDEAAPNNRAILRGDGGSLTQIAHSGQSLPDGNRFLLSFQQHDFNDAGQDAFFATTQCPVNCGFDQISYAIFRGDGTQLNEIVRLGQPVPDSNRTFVSFPSANIKINRAGQVAFVAEPTREARDPPSVPPYGLYVGDGTQITKIVQIGDVLDVGGGDFRIVSWIPDTRWMDWNDFGQLAFQLRFGDGSAGIFVSNALAHLPADFNGDGTVDAADYVIWRKMGDTADGFDAWRTNFGRSLFVGSGAALSSGAPLSASVPEPASFVLLLVGAALMQGVRRPATSGF